MGREGKEEMTRRRIVVDRREWRSVFGRECCTQNPIPISLTRMPQFLLCPSVHTYLCPLSIFDWTVNSLSADPVSISMLLIISINVSIKSCIIWVLFTFWSNFLHEGSYLPLRTFEKSSFRIIY